MRILQIVQQPERRGAEVFACQLSDELRRRGHAVSIAYLYPSRGDRPLTPGAEDRRLDGRADHPLERTLGFHPGLLRQLLGHLGRFRPDVVQANGARTVKYGALARRLRRREAWRLVYRNIGDPDRWVRGAARRLFYRFAVMPGVDGVVGVSRATLARVLELFGERPSVHVPQAVDPASLAVAEDRRSLRARLGTSPEAPVAVFVGSLTAEKRPDRLLAALRRAREGHPELELWLVGGGPLEADVRRRARAAGLDGAVRLLGVQERVADYLAAADLFVLASDTEGQPGALLEAAWLGLPAVATLVGGVPEVVTHGETGLLVEPDDGAALAEALGRLLDRPEERAALGERARERVRGRHEIATAAEGYLAFYRELLREEGRS